MTYRRGRITQRPGRHPAGAGIALAALTLTVAGCTGHVLPLGPTPATPAPRHLASPVVLQLVLGRQTEPAGGCPAGFAVLAGPGDQPPEAASPCFRKTGTPVTFTSAGVALYYQPAGNQDGHQQPAQYGLNITLPAAEAAALKAITTRAYGSRDPLAITIAGQTWDIPQVLAPLTNGQFEIPAQSKDQALQLQRILLAPA